MPAVNEVTLIGNLTRDPELKYIANGTALTTLGLAMNEKRKGKDGNYHDEATFVDVTVWGKAAENAGKYLGKGRLVYVRGRLKNEEWEQNGQKRRKLAIVATEVVYLDKGTMEAKPQHQEYSEDDIPF